MDGFSVTLLNTVDRTISHVGPLSKLVDAIVSRIGSTETAQAGCEYCETCEPDCYIWTGRKSGPGYSCGTCGGMLRSTRRCSPC